MIRVTVERTGQKDEVRSFASLKDIVVGREEGVDLRLATDDGASRQHCRLSFDDGRVFVTDLGSRHGTFIGERRVTGRQEVPAGEKVGVGSVWLSVSIEPAQLQLSPGAGSSSEAAEFCREKIAPVARRWEELDHPSEMLLRGDLLKRAVAWRDGKELPRPDTLEREFITRSQSYRRESRVRWGIRAGLVLGTTFSSLAMSEALAPELHLEPVTLRTTSSSRCQEPSRLWAEAALKKSEAEADPARKLLLAAHAYDAAERGGCGRKVHAEATLRELLAQPHGRVLGRHLEAVQSIAVATSGDARWIATTDGTTVKLWDPRGRNPPEVLSSDLAEIRALALSPDGKQLVVAGEAKLELWEISSGKPLRTQELPAGRVSSAGWSADGRLLATAAGNTLQLWDLDNPSASSTSVSGHRGEIERIVFGDDGKHMYTFGDGEANVWPLGGKTISGARIPLPGTGRLTAFAMSPRGTRVATGDEGGEVITWTLKGRRLTGLPLKNHHNGPVVAIAFALDGERVISSGMDMKLLSHQKGGGIATEVGLEDTPTGLAVDPSGHRVVCVGEGGVRVWELSKLEDSSPLVTSQGTITKSASGGPWLVTGGPDRSVRVWDVQSMVAGGAQLLGDHSKPVLELVAGQSGTRVASADEGGSIRVWQIDETGIPSTRAAFTSGDSPVLALTRDGRWLAAGGADRRVTLWDLDDASSHIPKGKVYTGHSDEITHLLFSTDDRWLVSADLSGSVNVWEVRNSGLEKPVGLSLGEEEVLALAVSKSAAAASTKGAIHVWGLPSRSMQRMSRKDPVTSLVFSPDGTRLAAGDEHFRVHLWRLGAENTLEQDGDFPTPLPHRDTISAVDFSATRLATGTDNGVLRVWPLVKDAEPLEITGHAGKITGLTFTRDGETLVSGAKDGTMKIWRFDESGGLVTDATVTLSGHVDRINKLAVPASSDVIFSAGQDGTVRAWPLAREALIARACDAVGRSLTMEEWTMYFPGPDAKDRELCPER